MNNQYYDENNMNEVFDRKCKCGHELYQHGNTMQFDYTTQQQYLRVSQCLFCDCKEFELEKNNENRHLDE